ncbi:HAMP domain-containing histidine kinase [Anabaena sp. UHCC 0187]|uniref:sensor histidine kinase n=1 Tax=Anabaena sp. UHCC 0187 TaxID=2590018 RepID=UPI001445047D|nr:HAMP domain-containing sensor histidine kinase [Anabaena sp. UHCC 0187]MTJ14907.1 HAMP domain-containing histidine kinase [Anabaena sp. UHCC 0187]
MLMSASSDFLALCREQIALLTQGMGACFTVVYLTQELVEKPTGEARLIPVMVYPETTALTDGNEYSEPEDSYPVRLANVLTLPNQQMRLLKPTSVSSHQSAESAAKGKQNLHNGQDEYLLSHNQIVLPLIYEGVMMGLLVTAREDREWNEREEREIERIAKTLAIACILDQRQAWLQHQLQQEQILQERQRDLLDNLLHQFRNPLTAIRTFGKLLFKRMQPVDPNREVATSIVRESDRLQELLQQFDQVIDLNTADLEPLPLPESKVIINQNVQKAAKPALLLPGIGEQLIDCSLADLLAPLLISAQAIAQERNLQLITEIPHNLPLVRVNEKALREVLSNIIDNALKYTPAGGKILVQCGQQKGNFQGIAISDTGPGIPSEDLEHLGERHYRGVQAKTEIPGTGLGITIAKQLIAEMQGNIEVFSPAIHSIITLPHISGTTFIIWLPLVD